MGLESARVQSLGGVQHWGGLHACGALVKGCHGKRDEWTLVLLPNLHGGRNELAALLLKQCMFYSQFILALAGYWIVLVLQNGESYIGQHLYQQVCNKKIPVYSLYCTGMCRQE